MTIDKFLEIESKYNLCQKEIEDVNYWVYERFWLWNYKICASSLNLMPSQSIAKQGICDWLITLGTLMKNSIFRGKISDKKYEVCFIAHERRKKVGNYYECIYTEELSKYFENQITLEEPFELKHFKPVANKALYYTDYVLMIGELYSLVNIRLRTKVYKKIYNQVKSEICNPIKEIIEEYKVNINPEEIYRLFARRILIVKICRKKYEQLLLKIHPKVIVEVVHYNAQNMMINEVADKYGIKTIELQHGTMHDEHLAYQYSINEKLKQLPYKIFTFSEYWNHIIHLPQQSTKVIATGFPYFEKQVKKITKNENNKIKNILFLSQGTIGGYLFKLAEELNALINKDQYHIVYKLHPAEYSDWKERYGIQDDSLIEVIDNANINLYELFAQSSIQVGVYSTAVYEGIGFGLQTYIYNIGHANTMKSLVDEGMATFVNSAQELFECIRNCTQLKKDYGLFWKKNALKNIIELLEAELAID